MFKKNITDAFVKLKAYCEAENFAGWDPYDGLNSKIFQATPLKHWDVARLVLIQVFKRNPINFRRLFLIPKQHNAKGIGLFLNGYCNLYQLAKRGDNRFGSEEELLEKITELADLLLAMRNTNYSGACWGYNFDWQSKAFFLPINTPTVVATSFVVDALFQAFEITKDKRYLETALSSASFVLNDLNRIEKPNGLFMFSYSPLDKQAVYNATLLGTKILSQIYLYTKDEALKEAAYMSALAVVKCQNDDGSFPHSDQVGQSWRDNFHTGFKLESLIVYQSLCGDTQFNTSIESGFNYWLDNYFNQETGFSFYYDRAMQESLVDLHCVAQALVTFYKLGKLSKFEHLVDKIAMWPIENMQSEQGYFYFQKKGSRLNKTAYMRWPNAWMFYGMSFLFLGKVEND